MAAAAEAEQVALRQLEEEVATRSALEAQLAARHDEHAALEAQLARLADETGGMAELRELCDQERAAAESAARRLEEVQVGGWEGHVIDCWERGVVCAHGVSWTRGGSMKACASSFIQHCSLWCTGHCRHFLALEVRNDWNRH